MADKTKLRRSKRLRQKANKSAPTRVYSTRQTVDMGTEHVHTKTPAQTRTRTPAQTRTRTPAQTRTRTPARTSVKKGKVIVGSNTTTSAPLPGTSRSNDADKLRRNKGVEPGRSTPRIKKEAISRSKSPSRYEQREQILQDLRKRIESISFANRPVPNTNSVKALAKELKLRLASRCLPFHETGRRGGKVKVTTIPQRDRQVPMWAITREQDPVPFGEEKVIVSNWKSLVRKGG